MACAEADRTDLTKWLVVILQSSLPSGPGTPTGRGPKKIKTPHSSDLGSQRALDIRKLSTFVHHKLSPIVLTSCPQIYEFPCPVIWTWIQGGLQTEGYRDQESASVS